MLLVAVEVERSKVRCGSWAQRVSIDARPRIGRNARVKTRQMGVCGCGWMDILDALGVQQQMYQCAVFGQMQGRVPERVAR